MAASASGIGVDCLQPYYFHAHLVGSEGSLLDNKFHSTKLGGLNKAKWSELSMKLLDSGDVSDHPYQTQFEAFFDCAGRRAKKCRSRVWRMRCGRTRSSSRRIIPRRTARAQAPFALAAIHAPTPKPSPTSPFAIAAHPDDIEFYMAGTLLLLQRGRLRNPLHDAGQRICGSLEVFGRANAAIRRAESKRGRSAFSARLFIQAWWTIWRFFTTLPYLRRLAAVIRRGEAVHRADAFAAGLHGRPHELLPGWR